MLACIPQIAEAVDMLPTIYTRNANMNHRGHLKKIWQMMLPSDNFLCPDEN